MTSRALLLAVALTLPASLALAQGAAEPATKLSASAADVQALIAKAKAMPPKPLISENIVYLAPYRVNLEYRAIPGAAVAIHDKEDELIYVLEGSGTFTVGGTMEGATRSNPENQSGTSITGGTVSHLSKGDFLFVPAGTPHLSVPDKGVAMALMVEHSPHVGGKQD